MDENEQFIGSMILTVKCLSKEALKFDEKSKEYKLYKNTLSQMWNLIGNNGILLNPIRYSVKAQEKFERVRPGLKEQGIHSLSELKWSKWNSLRKKEGFTCLNKLLWEHAYTRNDFASNAIKIVEEDKNVDVKLGELIKEHQIIWITRKENKKLSHNKYRSSRPNGWRAAYEKCPGFKL